MTLGRWRAACSGRSECTGTGKRGPHRFPEGFPLARATDTLQSAQDGRSSCLKLCGKSLSLGTVAVLTSGEISQPEIVTRGTKDLRGPRPVPQSSRMLQGRVSVSQEQLLTQTKGTSQAHASFPNRREDPRPGGRCTAWSHVPACWWNSPATRPSAPVGENPLGLQRQARAGALALTLSSRRAAPWSGSGAGSRP